MTFKLAAALLPALLMFTATAKADVTAADLTSEAPVLENAALETGNPIRRRAASRPGSQASPPRPIRRNRPRGRARTRKK